MPGPNRIFHLYQSPSLAAQAPLGRRWLCSSAKTVDLTAGPLNLMHGYETLVYFISYRDQYILAWDSDTLLRFMPLDMHECPP